MKKLVLPFLLSMVLLTSACTKEPRLYEYNVVVASGPEGWPIWAEQISVDGGFIAGGVNGRGFDDRPPVGASTSILGAASAPKKVEARWFAYRKQAFYEVAFDLPENMDQLLNDWYDTYPEPDYSHSLLLGFSGKGEAQAWWFAQCSACGFDRSQDFSTPLVENVRAEEVLGDPDKYHLQTQEFIDEGRVPASVLD